MFYDRLYFNQITTFHNIFVAVDEEYDTHMQQQDDYPELCIGIIVERPHKTIPKDTCRHE
jgi:hypothetical protein